MRISDWSSDVCSSDLDREIARHSGDGFRPGRRVRRIAVVGGRDLAAEAAIDTVMRGQMVEHRGHVGLAVDQPQLAPGTAPAQHNGVVSVLSLIALSATDIGVLDADRVIATP